MTTSSALLLPSDLKMSLLSLGSLVVLASAVAPVLTRSIPLPDMSPATPVAHTTATVSIAVAQAQQQAQAAAPAAPAAAALAFKAPAAPASALEGVPGPADSYYEKLRTKLRWVNVKVGEDRLQTPDLRSRLLLARSAAARANLDQVGLNYRDVYGIINAETSWIPRMGASKDGTPNLGIAQFEPATAKALGLRNPHDPVEAVHVAALHLKEAAVWSIKRIAPLKLTPEQHAQKLREGISIYYNLSSKGRAAWDGKNTDTLPRETQLHIKNARRGMLAVASMEEQLGKVRELTQVKSEGSLALNAAPKNGGI